MVKICSELGDITRFDTDAIVNAANRAMRGGGGVDGAIHKAGGPEILRECISRFPNGLETGDAGFTGGGKLKAKWVIHTVGPNYRAGQCDRKLLESCYRRCLQVGEELGVKTIAFPLISAGVYGWPKSDAINIAVNTIWRTHADIDKAVLVAFDEETFNQVSNRIEFVLAQGE